MEAIGNFFQAIYMFFYNSGFVIGTTILFLVFFALEIGLIYVYWRVIAFFYNTLVPILKRGKEFFEGLSG